MGLEWCQGQRNIVQPQGDSFFQLPKRGLTQSRDLVGALLRGSLCALLARTLFGCCRLVGAKSNMVRSEGARDQGVAVARNKQGKGGVFAISGGCCLPRGGELCHEGFGVAVEALGICVKMEHIGITLAGIAEINM